MDEFAQLDHLAVAEPNWNGEGSRAPTAAEIDTAKRFITRMREAGLEPGFPTLDNIGHPMMDCEVDESHAICLYFGEGEIGVWVGDDADIDVTLGEDAAFAVVSDLMARPEWRKCL